MNEFQKTITQIIVSVFTNKKSITVKDFDLNEIYAFAVRQNCAPLIYRGLRLNGVDDTLPEMQRLFNEQAKALFINYHQQKAAEEIFKIFDSNGIQYWPLKGIVCKNYYPEPQFRAMSDLDILIKVEQYPKIKELMLATGYNEGIESDHELIWEKDYVHIELHKYVIPSYNKDYYSVLGTGWQLAEKPVEGQYIVLLTHLAKHYRDSGIGINQLNDIWIYRRANPNMDLIFVQNQLEKMKLWDFHNNVIRTVENWYQGGQEDEITNMITTKVFAAGPYGNRETAVISTGLKLFGKKKNVKLSNIVITVFPPYSWMKERNPELKERPALLPLYWVGRLISAPFTKGKRRHISILADRIKTLDTGIIADYKKELNAVGLDFNW